MKYSIGDLLSAAANGTLVVAATVIAGLLVRREFIAPPSAQAEERLITQEDWRLYVSGDNRLGPADAAVVLVEFGDYQCPACRTFDIALRDARQRFPNDLAVIYRHYPLARIHPQAEAAARASECGARQGRFEAIHTLLFERADSIGVLPWIEFAKRSNIPDVPMFSACLADSASLAAVNRDREAGIRLNVRATPTALINGVRFTGTLEARVLDSLIQAAIPATRKGR